MQRPSLTALLLATAAPAAAAQNFSPSVAFSVHDEPIDGQGDRFNNAPFEGLIRRQTPLREDRALQEFDLASLGGVTISSATLSGSVRVNNAFDNGPRTFDFRIYAGNGQADLADYQITGTLVGSGSYHPPNQSSFSYSFDVTAVVQALLNGSSTWVGLRCESTSDPNFPNILDLTSSQLAVRVGSPWTFLGGGVGGTNGTPTLSGTGPLSGGSAGSLVLVNGLANAPSVLVLGYQQLGIPLLGGSLVPAPDVLLNLALDANGGFQLPFNVPAGVPTSGFVLFQQVWVVDPGAAQGMAASNGLRADFP